MPIYKEIKSNNAEILVWKYEEGEPFDKDLFFAKQDAKNLSSKRLIESKMVRQMLRIILPNHRIFYHENGEPYLEPTGKNISISHSFPYAVLAISDGKIGVDIEKIKDKIEKIKLKFLHKNEIKWLENIANQKEYSTCIWVLKEALFKIHQSKQWSFREYYEIDEFSLNSLSNIQCRVFYENQIDEFRAVIKKIDDYYLSIVQSYG